MPLADNCQRCSLRGTGIPLFAPGTTWGGGGASLLSCDATDYLWETDGVNNSCSLPFTASVLLECVRCSNHEEAASQNERWTPLPPSPSQAGRVSPRPQRQDSRNKLTVTVPSSRPTMSSATPSCVRSYRFSAVTPFPMPPPPGSSQVLRRTDGPSGEMCPRVPLSVPYTIPPQSCRTLYREVGIMAPPDVNFLTLPERTEVAQV